MTDDLLSRHDVLLADLDGTLYRGPDVVPGAVEAVRSAELRGVPTVYVTNNASRSPSTVAGHLADLGFPARVADVRTSAQAGAAMLAERLPSGATVLVLGTPALADEVRERGLVPTGTGEGADAVVQGHSPDTGWRQLTEAVLAIRAGALWVATNVDLTLPTERGPLPGNGSMVQVVRNAAGVEPAVAGKPGARLLREGQGDADRPLVLGDRLDTDIEGANALGAPSLMVLTGVSGAADLLAAPPALRPTYIGADLAAFTRHPDELVPGARDGWRAEIDGDALVLSGDGHGDEPVVDALRVLCAAAWEHGTHRVTASGDVAAGVLHELGLADRRADRRAD
ncbi:4-nitrophenylphosphatase [Pseudonocardia sp. Ae168_Ps1]|uniref:HAD hydrolase-like protein n=1 Tax=unclassified Pseudonocardia TaxID=2619320 RepID=UPI00094AA547|nr:MULTISPECIES: HAD hydrolase-like protein [unclassified Pseudonocardia]OLL71623.1 4-nitrophenylphosphatase [Pseudonocardia sp. Ae150A_Ps1]OLL77596.1 4-nitrophenylphosphatase [Pseudonocardia sp. Ae168_Ps1]OLL88286.1 4-nitrophenylphosphatase [Pseudonocardia sp. Ae263_Ps1]OLL91689.1 4-nitrophenylphosphatase [Pseudonocardia sp. Ae356_Ps1]